MKLSSFIFKSRTLEGFPVIVAGICPQSFEPMAKKTMNDIIKGFQAEGVKDGFELDYKLAQYVCSKTPEYILALGVSIFVPGVKEPAGGIIGNPRKSISSACGLIESIGNNLSLVAYPGGPGVVIESPPGKAANILNIAKAKGRNDIETVIQIAIKILTHSIANAIIISDGSGVQGVGCGAAIRGNRVELCILN
ncbi:hypothetical protein [Thermosediminibacter litoriperuensis]|uniref:Uncharacterized protein n=1 Tax=Thermosediminibacter litoriperuensis TaxID=291989 RepID=A0A5S5ASN2_9FIRM|nr:hypothetical protein [Thermosediminibacter litoriperuensis]TYP55457.1 hypothetical protein LZ11_01172 [Thermosediminibacter litoriperuensis]